MLPLPCQLQQAALDVSDHADAAGRPTVRFVDSEDILSLVFERPTLIVLPPQPLRRLGPPSLEPRRCRCARRTRPTCS